MTLVAGSRLGPYEILSSIGRGGMGEVYKARDTRLDRAVAVKVLPSELATDPDRRQRFEREARAIAALEHPDICPLYDVGHHDGIHYLVMQHLDGETLAARLARGPLPLDQVLQVGVAIARALDRTHRSGITHRDLKPANVMLTRSGPKLLDFGLAKLRTAQPVSMSAMAGDGTAGPTTAQGTIAGTLQYMAPEQLEGREADARCDIWALGVVLYEMATGTRPFAGDTPASVIGAILKDTPPAISARQPLAPRALDQLVDRCLAKDPDERWQSIGDVGRMLEGIAAAGNAGAERPAKAGGFSKERLAWVSITALLAVLAAIGLWRRPAAPASSTRTAR
jgi:serine/threonine-protein kinase